MEFLDREEERSRLTRVLDGADGALVCLYGRRRCGKTRLLRECVRERLVRATLARRSLPDSDTRWRGVSRWWGAGLDHHPMELDVVAESEDGKVLLVGEAKLALGAAEAKRCREHLIEKATRLPFVRRYDRVEARLFVATRPPEGAVSQTWCEGLS